MPRRGYLFVANKYKIRLCPVGATLTMAIGT